MTSQDYSEFIEALVTRCGEHACTFLTDNTKQRITGLWECLKMDPEWMAEHCLPSVTTMTLFQALRKRCRQGSDDAVVVRVVSVAHTHVDELLSMCTSDEDLAMMLLQHSRAVPTLVTISRAIDRGHLRVLRHVVQVTGLVPTIDHLKNAMQRGCETSVHILAPRVIFGPFQLMQTVESATVFFRWRSKDAVLALATSFLANPTVQPSEFLHACAIHANAEWIEAVVELAPQIQLTDHVLEKAVNGGRMPCVLAVAQRDPYRVLRLVCRAWVREPKMHYYYLPHLTRHSPEPTASAACARVCDASQHE